MKSFELRETKNPDLFRVVDRDGNWEHYFHKPSGRYLRGATTILSKGYAKGDGLLKFLAQHTERERDEILRAAGERGDMVHRLIDLALSSDLPMIRFNRNDAVYSREIEDERLLSNDEWDCALAFARFWGDHAPVVIHSEHPVYSLERGYAGTTDAVLILTSECGNRYCQCKGLVGKPGLFDWKTSGAIHPSYWAQAASYASADNMPKVEYTAILRLGTSHKTSGGYELKAHTSIAQDFAIFEAARLIAEVDYRPFDPTTDIQEIPDVIEIARFVIQTPKPAKTKKPRKLKAKTKKSHG